MLWRSGHSHRRPNCAYFCVSDYFSERAFRAARRRNLAGPPWQVSKQKSLLNCTLGLPRQYNRLRLLFNRLAFVGQMVGSMRVREAADRQRVGLMRDVCYTHGSDNAEGGLMFLYTFAKHRGDWACWVKPQIGSYISAPPSRKFCVFSVTSSQQCNAFQLVRTQLMTFTSIHQRELLLRGEILNTW